MQIDITQDNKYILLASPFQQEMVIMRTELTREMANAWILKKSKPFINTERCFMNDYGMVPIGLWLTVLQACRKYNFQAQMSPAFVAYVNQFNMDFNDFKAYVDSTFEGAVTDKGKPFAPYDYQVEAAYSMLKYKMCCGEISTSGGKTLISFIIFKYLLDRCGAKKILYIVPSVDLATQSAEKYEVYESFLRNGGERNWEIGILKAGLKKGEKEKVENCNILFGTYQSLCKRPVEFFADFTATIIDEAHHIGGAVSVTNILNKCVNNSYCIAVTGTFPKPNTIENLTIQSYVGPVVYTKTADSLINDEKAATPIYIVFQMLRWATLEEMASLWMERRKKEMEEYQDDLTLGIRLMAREQEFVNDSEKRMKFIGNMACRMLNNTLILFGDVKGGYGKRMQEYIKDNCDKNVYYIDGNTPEDIRSYYKQQCAEDKEGKTIIVGSIYTMGEGIDVPNLGSIFLVNTAKSERIIRQIVGRGLRNCEGKTKCVLYDFVDDLRYSENRKFKDNYMWKHYLERKKIYKEQNFPIYEQTKEF